MTTDDRTPLPPASLRTLSALSNPTFRRLWASSWTYYTYRSMELAVLSWLVLELTDSAFQVAVVGASRAAPMFFFGLMAGSISDRFRRHSVMVAGQSLNALVVVVLATLMFTGSVVAWHAYIAVAVTGFSWALDFTARRAYLSSLFSGRALTNAMSLDTGVLMSSNLTGPVIGTLLIRWAGFSGAYVGIALLTSAGLFAIASLRRDVRSASVQGSAANPVTAITEALAAAKAYRGVAASVSLTAVFGLFGWPITTQIPVIARDELGVPEVLYGVLVGGIGAGAVIGTVILATVNPRRRGAVYSGGTLLFLLAALAFSFSPWYGLSVGLLVVAGIGSVCFAIMQPLLVVEIVPPELRGRALGAIALAIGANPIGMLTVGAAANVIGPRASVAAMTSIGIVAVLLLVWRFPVLRDAGERGREAGS